MNTSSLYLLGTLIVVAVTGSWHCGVMCGPIACGFIKKGNIFYYHLGRLISYVGGGMLFGFLGKTLFIVESLPAKIIVAIVLSSFFILPLTSNSFFEKYLHNFIFNILRINKGLFVFGFMSALLPCGWLWTFYAGAASSGSPWAGALVTFVLWTSSLPALSVLPMFFKKNFKGLHARRVEMAQKVLSIAGIYAVFSHLFL